MAAAQGEEKQQTTCITLVIIPMDAGMAEVTGLLRRFEQWVPRRGLRHAIRGTSKLIKL